MRRLTAAGELFNMSFMSYNSSKNSTEGIVSVQRAKLTPRPSSDKNKHADYMISYYDYDIMENRQCWQPLIMSFQGQKVDMI